MKHVDHIDRSSTVVFARWWGLGIFPLARVAQGKLEILLVVDDDEIVLKTGILTGCAFPRQDRMLLQLLALSGSLFVFLACAAAQDTSSFQPEPTSASDRFQYYLTRTYSWQKMGWIGADTVLDQLHGKPEWGRGMGGFGCRYASSFGRGMISNSVEFGAIMALKQDTRFHPSHLTGLFPRLRYAAFHAFLATGEGGTTVPAYARFAGIAGGALIEPAWHRHTLSASGFGQDFASSTMDQIQNSLLTEFGPDFERVGRSIRRKIFGR